MSIEEQVDEILKDAMGASAFQQLHREEVKHQILSLIKQARIDELERFKLNRSHNKGELELINNRLKQLTEDK